MSIYADCSVDVVTAISKFYDLLFFLDLAVFQLH